MGFLVRLLACMATVLSLSVLAALAWDGSDNAASAAAGEVAPPKTAAP